MNEKYYDKLTGKEIVLTSKQAKEKFIIDRLWHSVGDLYWGTENGDMFKEKNNEFRMKIKKDIYDLITDIMRVSK